MYNVQCKAYTLYINVLYVPTSFLASGVEALGGCCSLFRSTFSDENAPGEEEEEEKEEGPWMAAIARDAGVCIAREIEHIIATTYLHVQLYHNTISTMLSDLMLSRQDMYMHMPGSSYFFATKW